MNSELMIRVTAGLLGTTAFMPWYSSNALVDRDTYLGNPLPWIDLFLVAVALATVIRPPLALAAAVVGLIDVGLGALLMYGDAAEGLEVSLLPGLPLATAATVGLFIIRRRAHLPPSG